MHVRKTPHHRDTKTMSPTQKAPRAFATTVSALQSLLSAQGQPRSHQRFTGHSLKSHTPGTAFCFKRSVNDGQARAVPRGREPTVEVPWATAWQFLKKLHLELPYASATPLRGAHTQAKRKYTSTQNLVRKLAGRPHS